MLLGSGRNCRWMENDDVKVLRLTKCRLNVCAWATRDEAVTFCTIIGGTMRFGSRGMMISMGCERSVRTITSLPSLSRSENETERDTLVLGAVALRSATANRLTIA